MREITKKYKELWEQYTAEYGERTIVLMQIGSFYQMLMVKNDTMCFGNLDVVARIMNNVKITKCNKNVSGVDISNPNMAGFPKNAMSKYIDPVIEAGYTVVVIDQDDINKSERKVTGIFSPSMPPIDYNESSEEGLIGIYMDVYCKTKSAKAKVSVEWSVVYANVRNNKLEVYDGAETSIHDAFDAIYRVMSRYHFSEVCILVTGQDGVVGEREMTEYLNLHDLSVHYKNELSVDDKFLNEYFKKVYKHIQFGIMDPIDYFGLEQHGACTRNLLQIFEFIGRHDADYLDSIAAPQHVQESQYLMLEMNTIGQLNIFDTETSKKHKYGSLMSVIDKTSTVIGKRALRALLSKPYKSKHDMDRMYDISDGINEKAESVKDLLNLLKETIDFSRIGRKMSLGRITPSELGDLDCAYSSVCELKSMLGSMGVVAINKLVEEVDWEKLNELVREWGDALHMESIKEFMFGELQTNTTLEAEGRGMLFRRGYTKELDSIYDRMILVEKEIGMMRDELEKKIKGSGDWVKLGYTETEGYYFTCTKIRGAVLSKDDRYSLKAIGNLYKISSDALKQKSLELSNVTVLYRRRCESLFREFTIELYKQNCEVMESIVNFVATIDIALSNVLCKQKYRYCRAEIVEGEGGSFIEAYDLRHPIIERVNTDTAYVPNDVVLNELNRGIVLYAFNACGKSSLLRSIGLNVVMAQCGLYVPCTKLVIKPFDTILTQVDMYDNLWKSHSSFMAEMAGLSKINKLATDRTLVLSDELTKGTEIKSATSIFSAAVLFLVKRGAKFVFTTHLHGVKDCKEIVSNERVKICHLSVDIRNDEIIFERKIKPGPTNDLYGIEVAKAMGLSDEFIKSAYNIRNELFGQSVVMKVKKSRYNSKKILDACEVCGYTPKFENDIPLETHHILEQNEADSENFIKTIHKNAKHNLATLCKSCHGKHHNGEYIIKGYISTTNGVKLDWEEVKTSI